MCSLFYKVLHWCISFLEDIDINVLTAASKTTSVAIFDLMLFDLAAHVDLSTSRDQAGTSLYYKQLCPSAPLYTYLMYF